MSKCRNPIEMFRDSHGNIHTYNRQGVAHTHFQVPCGQCIFCRLNHAESWAVRMMHHTRQYSENSFLTLTYSDDKLPENNSLAYDDVTQFIKRLRKVLSKTPYKNNIAYYRAGEYGSITKRPHYHLILFGFDFSYKLRYKGIQNEKTLSSSKDDRKYYKSNFLESCWSHGFADIGDVDYATCMYVAKYTLKKSTGAAKKSAYTRLNEFGEYVEIAPEKSAMSKGIGKKFLEQYYSDIYPHDSVNHNGKKLRVPRYYDNWLEKNHPLLLEQVKIQRESSMMEVQPSAVDNLRELKFQYLKQQNFKRGKLTPPLDNDRLVIERMESDLHPYHFEQKLRNQNA